MPPRSRWLRALRFFGAAALAAGVAGAAYAVAGHADAARRAIAFSITLGGLTLLGAALILIRTRRAGASQETP